MADKLINAAIPLGENTLLREAIDTILPFGNRSDGTNSLTSSVNGKHMNNIKETGIYYGYNMTGSAETTISTFLVMGYSLDWIVQVQFVMTHTYSRIYIRRFYGATTWSAWERVH